MSDLTGREKRALEGLLNQRGYVLDFSNSRFAEFVQESTGRDIYDAKYANRGTSKGNRLRGFWEEEPNPVIAKLLGDLVDHAVDISFATAQPAAVEACRKIVTRLRASNPMPALDTIVKIGNEHDLDEVTRAVRDAIEKQDFVGGIDRLHTFSTGFVRSLCEKHAVVIDRGKPLHSVFGELTRKFHAEGHLQSKMVASILSSFGKPFDAFNDARNNQSLAHDNELLNHDEAQLIFEHVTSALRFLRELDQRIARRKKAEGHKDAQTPNYDDGDISF
jgi:Abortive infection C-terminus